MRILLDYRPALRERTGVGEYIHELARAVAQSAPSGESLTLFSSSYKNRLPDDPVPGTETVDRRVPVSVLNFAWHRLQWPPVERLATGPFDIVHAAHPLLIPTTGAARIATIYDLDFLDHPERSHAEIRRDYADLAASHARDADHIITISEHSAREIQTRFGVSASQVSICAPGAPAWRARDHEPFAGPILFLGSLVPRKNLATLLEAYERLIARRPDAPALILAGNITDASAPILARAQRPPLAGRVELPGYIEPAERESLYKRAAVFVLPSFTEGFGMPILEAMAAGVPVIAAHAGALPEAVGTAGRLFDPSDPEALAVALDAVLGSAEARARMSAEGQTQARRFTWTAAAAGVRDGWARAIEHRRGRRG